MTCEEALKTLDETVIGNLELKIVLSNALEKQIPKKPKECGEDWFVCPKCETSIVSLDELETHKFCLNCGQEIDWSDTE